MITAIEHRYANRRLREVARSTEAAEATADDDDMRGVPVIHAD
jgi:hypothetical protein